MDLDDPYQLAPLLQQSCNGDAQTLNDLLGRVRPYLTALVRSWLGPDLARRLADSDVVQVALLRASRHFATFRGKSVPELLGWLRKIALRAAYDQRQTIAPAGHGSDDPLGALPDEGPGPLETLEREEAALRLAAALEQLPAARREVIHYRLLDGLEFAEISRHMGKSAGALRVLFVRALSELRDILEVRP